MEKLKLIKLRNHEGGFQKWVTFICKESETFNAEHQSIFKNCVIDRTSQTSFLLTVPYENDKKTKIIFSVGNILPYKYSFGNHHAISSAYFSSKLVPMDLGISEDCYEQILDEFFPDAIIHVVTVEHPENKQARMVHKCSEKSNITAYLEQLLTGDYNELTFRREAMTRDEFKLLDEAQSPFGL